MTDAPLPWDDLADAFERFQDARRARECAEDGFDLALATAELEAATANLERAKERICALGNLLFLYALAEPSSVVQQKLLELFSNSSQAAWDRATKALKRVAWCVAELDAIKERVRELEEQLARRTPGVGEPGLRVVG